MTAEPQQAVVGYPGGIRVRYRWAGSGGGGAVFALSEAGGELFEYGERAGAAFERLCRAELRTEGPAGVWAARLASPIFDAPAGLAWDTAGLLIVKYGFLTYGLVARTGELRWSHRSGSPVLAVLGSVRLPHVIVQAEIETFALEEDGDVRWRVGHSDVVAECGLTGGRLILTSYGGLVSALDPATGQALT
ncbi:MAG: PQQ-binding-like beta-propeller repeat protein [Candidatus Limnocylindrales bacterium]|nr:PQQ-binding-like beta-propeller repeat protein [Candidatus Limnocylindrales bacterium]